MTEGFTQPEKAVTDADLPQRREWRARPLGPNSRQRLIWIATAVGAVLLIGSKLWLTRGQSLLAIGFSLFDDRLYLTLASHLTQGHWLGPYNDLTLVKMPFYSIWVALSFALSVPLLLGEQLLYLGAVALLVWTLRPVVRSRVWLAVLFAVVAWNPASFADQMMTRPIREGIYPALVLLVFVTALGIAIRVKEGRSTVLWAVMLGTSGACTWLTREEGIWLLPVAGAALATRIGRPFPFRGLGAALALSTAVFAGILGAVLWKNHRQYGLAVLSEQTGGPFVDAYRALTRVRHPHPRRYVPLPREVRERIYAASPTFARLRSGLEGPSQGGWISIGCKVYGVCDDVGSGAVHYDLRSAAAAIQVYGTGTQAGVFWRQIAQEVNEACDDRRLDCEVRRTGNAILSGWEAGAGRLFWDALREGTYALATFRGVTAIPTPSSGPLRALDLFRDLTGERLSGLDAGVRMLQVTGWAAHRGRRALDLRLEDGGTPAEGFTLEWLPRPDVLAARPGWFPDGERATPGFVVTGYCPGSCVIVVSEGATELARFPVFSGGVENHDLVVRTEDTRSVPWLPRQQRLDTRRIAFLEAIIGSYRAAAPPTLVLAVASWILVGVLAVRRRRFSGEWLMATAALVACGARLGLLAVVSAIAFPAMSAIYLSPAEPFLLAFIVLSLAAFARTVRPNSTKISKPEPATPVPV